MPTRDETETRAACLLGCGRGLAPLARSGPGRRYLRCRGCGLAFVFPFPDGRHIEAQYVGDTSSKSQYYERARAADEATFSRQLQRLDAWCPATGRLLDVGCSVGTLLGVARTRGWSVEGIEPNGRSAALARQRGFRVHDGCLTPPLADRLHGEYRCVVMNDVLEHVPDPREAVRLARGLLAPGGVLTILTPNAASVWTRLLQLKPVEHLFLFGDRSLRRLLNEEGFGVLALETTSRRRSLRQLSYSTTRLGPGLGRLVALLARLRLDGGVSRLMEILLRDQLLCFARKEG